MAASNKLKPRIPDFEIAVETAFSFLESDGFRIAERASNCVRYESKNVFVQIDWDQRSGEINVFIGAKAAAGKATDGFSLVDILDMEGLGEKLEMPFQVSDRNKLPFFIDDLAQKVRLHTLNALNGDLIYFRRLREFRNKKSQTLMSNMKNQQLRIQAEKAWQERQLDKVASIYGSMESILTPLEKQKLKYALAHASHS